MNKTFTLAALGLLLAVSANAQKVRKTWDFREGFSSATVANLYADMEQNGTAAHWRDWEKDATQSGKFGSTFWCADNGSTVNADNEAHLLFLYNSNEMDMRMSTRTSIVKLLQQKCHANRVQMLIIKRSATNILFP